MKSVAPELLWRKLMGTEVLESDVPIQAGLHVYAQCLRGHALGVAVLAINTDKVQPRALSLNVTSERFTLSAHELEGKTVALNGAELRLSAQGRPADIESRDDPGGCNRARPHNDHFSRGTGGRQPELPLTVWQDTRSNADLSSHLLQKEHVNVDIRRT